MLIIALVGAILLYVLLGYVWHAAQPGLNSSTPALDTLRGHILGVPQETALEILRGGIILMGFYLLADALIASSKRAKKRSAKQRDDDQRDDELRSSGYPGDDASASR